MLKSDNFFSAFRLLSIFATGKGEILSGATEKGKCGHHEARYEGKGKCFYDFYSQHDRHKK